STTTVAEDGIYLIGNQVRNNGRLKVNAAAKEILKHQGTEIIAVETENKKVFIGAADSFDINLDTFAITLQGDQLASLIENNGAIISNDRIELTASGTQALKKYAVNNNGVLEADSISIQGNKIVLGKDSDIRYGKQNKNNATLKITQTGTGTETGLEVSGKITALANSEQVNFSHRALQDRFKKGAEALDNDGKVYYLLDGELKSGAEKVDNSYKINDEIFTNKTEGEYQITLGRGLIFLKDGKETGSNSREDTYKLDGTFDIVKLTYIEVDGTITAVTVKEQPTNLDAVNTEILSTLLERISQGDYSSLGGEKFSELSNEVIEKHKARLQNELAISAEQIDLLQSGSYIAPKTIDDLAEQLSSKNGLRVADSKAKLLEFAALIPAEPNKSDSRRYTDFSAPEWVHNGEKWISIKKSRYINNNGKVLTPVTVSEAAENSVKQPLALPLTTISFTSNLKIQDAEFKQQNNAQHNLLLQANNSVEQPATIQIRNTTFDLGKGSVGIGSQTQPQQLTYTVTENYIEKQPLEAPALRVVNGVETPLYVLVDTAGKPKTENQTIAELLADITKKLKPYGLDEKHLDKSGESISFNQFWDEFIASESAAQSLKPPRSEKTVFKGQLLMALSNYAEEQKIQLASGSDDSLLNDYNIDVYDPSDYFSEILGNVDTKVKLRQGKVITYTDVTKQREQTYTAPGLSQQLPEFNITLENSTIRNSKDFVIADGFKNVTFDNVKTSDELGLYINAGIMRDYLQKNREKSQGHEYAIKDLHERVMRGSTPTDNKRYSLSYTDGNSKGKTEFDDMFEGWATSPQSRRSHIDGTNITIRNSQINSRDGFVHLVAKKVTLDNSPITVNYAKDLENETFMRFANKVGINGENIYLNNGKITVKGADVLGAAATPPSAGVFIIGNLIAEQSEIYTQTHQGYSFRTNGDTLLSGKNNQADLRITAVNTGYRPKADSGLGSLNGDEYLSAVAFSIGKAIKTDEAGNTISGTQTTLRNLTLTATAPNGGLAFQSNEASQYANLKVEDTAKFSYHELPRIVDTGSTKVTGNAQKLTLREALRYLDRVNGIRATNLTKQYQVIKEFSTSRYLPLNIIAGLSVPQEPLLSLCEEEQCKSLLVSDDQGNVSVGEVEDNSL
ncbi:hypothetical protein QV08_12215, partial [Gallibacterium salpingitidis]|uniref:hypothetical protein n=1 Tax=Gallibacterium salpingitidis TaxID=505341 RepID=UPI000804D622